MVKIKNINMTEGPLFKNIVLFTIPIILTNLLQLLFNAADIIVIGQFDGSIAVAAVGSSGSLVNLLVNIMIGLSVGTGIVTAQSIGAKDYKTTQRTVHSAIPIALVIGLTLSAIGFFFSGGILKLMDTPREVLPLATVYLKIYFLGVISSSVYNFGASILRAAGDTKSPLIFLSLSGLVNVGLNLIFVIAFKMSVAGVALATVISQTLSAVLVVRSLIKRRDECRLILSEMHIYKAVLMKIMRIGIPAGIQSSMFSISNVIIQSSINSFGAAIVSGNAAAVNIEGFIYTAMNAFHQTTLNFTGQNVGAGKFKRVKQVLWLNIASVTVVGLCLGLIACALGRGLLSIYITDSKIAVEEGLIRLLFMCALYFLCGIQDTLSGALRGMGTSVTPMLISIMGACGFRVLWIFTIFQIPNYHTTSMLYISYPISWMLTGIAYVIAYFIIIKKMKNRIERRY